MWKFGFTLKKKIFNILNNFQSPFVQIETDSQRPLRVAIDQIDNNADCTFFKNRSGKTWFSKNVLGSSSLNSSVERGFCFATTILAMAVRNS